MIRFILITCAAFVTMEFVAYLAHRYVYHGFLWIIHRSHHAPRKGPFELNDLFPLFFATITIALMVYALSEPSRLDLLAASIGIALYGSVYFFIHDLYVHRRMKSLSFRIPFLLLLKQAHAIHHRHGGEPYGLLFFADPRRAAAEAVRETEDV